MKDLFYYIYILTNKNNTVLYTGVTNDIVRRLAEHKSGLSKFTNRYNVHKLIYYEQHPTADSAIAREKQIKGWKRYKKIDLINTINPKWEEILLDETDSHSERSEESVNN